MNCDVCGKNDAEHVCCSASGAVSFRYCDECLEANCEPYGAVVASLLGCTTENDIADWYMPVVKATLENEGKTMEELMTDVVAFANEYMEALRDCEHPGLTFVVAEEEDREG